MSIPSPGARKNDDLKTQKQKRTILKMENRSEDLLAVIYSEFDNHVGPQLRYSYPNDVVTKEHFEIISDYVILEKHLCEQLILVSIDEWKVLIISVAIENPKYERNSLTFSFGFVLSHLANHDAYGKVLKRIVATFVDLEIESEFLFQKQTKQQLLQILPSLYQQLKNHQTLFLLLSSQSTNQHCLALQLYQTPRILFPVEDYDVPIFYKNHINLAQLPYDIAFQYLILSIDGISHVKKIIQDVNMDDEFVKRALSLLVFYQVIVLTDIFKFSNIYQLNNDYGMIMLYDQKTYQEMEEFLYDSYDIYEPTNNTATNTTTTPSASLTTGKKSLFPILPILNFLLNISPGRTIGDILLSQMSSSSVMVVGDEENTTTTTATATAAATGYTLSLANMDIGRLIAFVQMKGILRRVHEYPIYIDTAAAGKVAVNHNNHGQYATCYDEHGIISLSPTIHPTVGEGISISPPLHETSSSPFLSSSNNNLKTSYSNNNNNSETPPSVATTNRPFQKLSRSKTVIGKSFVKDTIGNGCGNDGNTNNANSHQIIAVQDILSELDGTHHLDDLCCKYDIGYFDIVNYPGVQIIYR